MRAPSLDAPAPEAQPDTGASGRRDAARRGTVVVRTQSFSLRLRVRAIAVCTVLGAAIAGLIIWSTMVGDFPLSASAVIEAILGDESDDAEFIVQTLRLPRALTGVLVGAALGMSGAVFQSLTRNPLGSPDIIGFQQGAAVGAVLMIVNGEPSAWGIALGAVAGGLVTSLAVYLLAFKRGTVSPARLVLVGIGAGFTAAAVTDFLITRAEIYDVQRAAVWLTGSLNGRSWEHVRTAGLALLVLTPVVIVSQRNLDRLELGDDTAAAIGVKVGRAKLTLVLAGVGLAALGVAAAGPIAFVAFVAGPTARRLTHSPGAAVIPSAFVGATLTVGADLAARRLLAPTELPVGILTAVIGGPYLLWLLVRGARAGSL